MKHLLRFTFILALVFMFAFPVFAHPTETGRAGDATPEPTPAPTAVSEVVVIDNDTNLPSEEVPPMDLPALVGQWLVLGGFAAIVALLINIGKVSGLVKDGTSATWSVGLNLTGIVALYALRIINPDVDIQQADTVASQLAQAGVIVLGLVMQLLVSKNTNAAVAGVPVIGKSFSQEKGETE